MSYCVGPPVFRNRLFLTCVDCVSGLSFKLLSSMSSYSISILALYRSMSKSSFSRLYVTEFLLLFTILSLMVLELFTIISLVCLFVSHFTCFWLNVLSTSFWSFSLPCMDVPRGFVFLSLKLPSLSPMLYEMSVYVLGLWFSLSWSTRRVRDDFPPPFLICCCYTTIFLSA